MDNQYIIITYKDGVSVSIKIILEYYQNKYRNNPNVKIHQKFLKDYNRFISALNKNKNIVNVKKYLPFSNAVISSKNILGIDIKDLDQETLKVFVPKDYDKVFLDLKDTKIDILLDKLNSINIVENINNLMQYLMENVSKLSVNVEAPTKIKGPSTSTKGRKKKTATTKVVEEEKEIGQEETNINE